jgi:hypothetical protein
MRWGFERLAGLSNHMTKAEATSVAGHTRQAPLERAVAAILAPTLDQLLAELSGIVLLVPILLSIALWNGFPIIYYDTGAYMLEGLGHVFIAERSPVYSLFLNAAGAGTSFWAIAVVQALMTAFVITEFARAHAPGMRLVSLVGIGVLLVALTGVDWYVVEIEPDCMAALVVLSLYLLAFHASALGRVRSGLLLLIAVLATASHSSHLGLAAGLTIALALLRLAPFVLRKMSAAIPQPNVGLPFSVFLLGFSLVLACNYNFTGKIFVSRAGPVFVFARLLQDGIVKKLLDETCPDSHYKLCAYKDRLPDRGDAWLWEKPSPFNALGRFQGTAVESQRIVVDSVKRYPFLQVKAALADTATQFVMFRTGDQIEPQEWVLFSPLDRLVPQQISAYLQARQQRGQIRFLTINEVDETVGVLSLLGLVVLIWRSAARRDWDELMLPAFIALALIGNAAICGTFSGPHNRYQSRVIWLPTFVILLSVAQNAPFSLRKPVESGT